MMGMNGPSQEVGPAKTPPVKSQGVGRIERCKYE